MSVSAHELFAIALHRDGREIIIAQLDPCVLRYFVHQKPQILDNDLVKDILREGEKPTVALLEKIGYKERDIEHVTMVRILAEFVDYSRRLGR